MDPDYFTMAEFRGLPDMDDLARFPESRVLAAAAYITSVVERETGTSFVHRQITETLDGSPSAGPVLSRYDVVSIDAATENGVAVAATLGQSGGVVEKVAGSTVLPWATGRRNLAITYTAGYSAAPPPDVKEQVMLGTRAHLLATHAQSGMDARRTSLNTEQGVITYAVAGPDHPTGYPEVDAMIRRWDRRIPAVG